MPQTTTQRLASLLLGEPVEHFIQQRRAQKRSWRLVARDLYDATGGQVDVTTVTLRAWVAAPADEVGAA